MTVDLRKERKGKFHLARFPLRNVGQRQSMRSAAAMRPLSAFTHFLLPLLFCCSTALSQYEDNDSVTLWLSKIGSYNNPQEVYNYYSLPFCLLTSNATQTSSRFGDILGGYMLADSQIDINFKRNVDMASLCKLSVDASMVKKFKTAIDKSYYFELFMDDLPLWGFFGDSYSDTKYQIYTHKNFEIGYNAKKIIQVNLTQDNPKLIEEGKVLNMTYSVKWIPTHINYAHRFDIYLDYPFFDRQTHWSSFSHPLFVVILLAILVSVVLMRTLCQDANEEADLETMESSVGEGSRWKLVHGDVFRPPQDISLLSAFVGVGAQLTVLVLLALILMIRGTLYVGRGVASTTLLFCYVVTSIVAGYVSSAVYSRSGGEDFIKTMMFTLLPFPCLCFGIGFIFNIVASFCGLFAAIPLQTMLTVFAIWAFVSLPFGVIGTILGRKWNVSSNDQSNVKSVLSRPIPLQKWYRTPSAISFLGGLLPFASIFIELSFLFASFWQYKVYYSYDILLLFFLILILVTICISIVGTYLLLNDENYLWQWTAFMSSASVSIYITLYSVYYFYTETRMSGLFQTTYYFGSCLFFSLSLGLLCGAVGYMASSLFVKRIYMNVKGD